MDKKHKLLHEAYRGVEKTIEQLADDLGISDEDPLDLACKVDLELKNLGVSCSPSLKKGKFGEKRVIYVEENDLYKIMKSDLCKKESEELEFKSTFLYDIEQAKNRKKVPISKLNPDVVIHSVLKSICGFLNAKGGSLYIGVEDDGSIFGLEKDFEFIGGDADFDKWELRLRSLIQGRFLHGEKIHRYIQIGQIEVEEMVVAKVTVKPRQQESFLKNPNGETLFYMRIGNRTDNIKIVDLPEVIRQRDLSRKELIKN